MIATMDENGVLTIKPETPVEAFALKTWSDSYDFTQEAQRVGRKSILLIDANLPKATEG